MTANPLDKFGKVVEAAQMAMKCMGKKIYPEGSIPTHDFVLFDEDVEALTTTLAALPSPENPEAVRILAEGIKVEADRGGYRPMSMLSAMQVAKWTLRALAGGKP